MSSLTRNDCAEFLRSHDRFAILTHRRPDGDTIGSAAGLCLGLQMLGKTAHVIENPEITPKYAPLFAGISKAWPEEGDTVVTVDVASPNMLPEHFRSLEKAVKLRIDHHGTATPFTELELVDGGAASCAEVVWDVLVLLGITLDKPMAEALYTGVSSDTGCFRFPNTTAHTLRAGAACVEAGADVQRINRELFETNSFTKLKMQSWITENVRLLAGGQIALVALPLAVEKEIGVTEDDMENISGFPRTIEGVKIAVTLRETADGKVKISCRAVPGYDMGAVCAQFGGGGHKGAAGATVALSLEEAAKAVVAALPEMD